MNGIKNKGKIRAKKAETRGRKIRLFPFQKNARKISSQKAEKRRIFRCETRAKHKQIQEKRGAKYSQKTLNFKVKRIKYPNFNFFLFQKANFKKRNQSFLKINLNFNFFRKNSAKNQNFFDFFRFFHLISNFSQKSTTFSKLASVNNSLLKYHF